VTDLRPSGALLDVAVIPQGTGNLKMEVIMTSVKIQDHEIVAGCRRDAIISAASDQWKEVSKGLHNCSHSSWNIMQATLRRVTGR
jgi:hypothetical protein